MDNSLIKDNILKTLLYYHVFNHPLTLNEIYFFHQKNKVTKHKVKHALNDIVADKNTMVGEVNGFYYIKPNKSNVEERLKKEMISNKSWKIAKIVSLFLKLFPFVRGIFVTGSLSKNSSYVNSDIDFLIICAEKRMWIARTSIRLFAKIFLLNKNKYLCSNYFISENNLSIDDKNIFTATELAHIKVMYNTKVLNQFIQSNKWIEQYFPIYPASNGMFHFPNADVRTNDARSIFQPFLEKFFPGKFGDVIDDFLRQQTQKRIKNKITDYADREKKQSITLTAGVAKVHGTTLGGNKRNILEKYQALLRQYQIFERNGPDTVAAQNM